MKCNACGHEAKSTVLGNSKFQCTNNFCQLTCPKCQTRKPLLYQLLGGSKYQCQKCFYEWNLK